MAISGTSYSAGYLPLDDGNKLRQSNKQALFDSADVDVVQREPAEFIFRGELLEDAVFNADFNDKRPQTIDPANQVAIEQYEGNSQPGVSPFLSRQGSILDAFA